LIELHQIEGIVEFFERFEGLRGRKKVGFGGVGGVVKRVDYLVVDYWSNWTLFALNVKVVHVVEWFVESVERGLWRDGG
jgi:homoserine trans-succinylase